MTDLETCSKCGAAVADSYRHKNWHEKNDDELSSLKRVVRDLETSTKRSLQQFEASGSPTAVTAPGACSARRLRKRQRRRVEAGIPTCTASADR